MRRTFTVFCLFALLTGVLLAGDQSFAFALPEREGRISLGVYDSSGRLVRTLCAGATEGDFQIGLNGLIATWDGKNDAGRPLPAGSYRVRGWVVPDAVEVEGEAYHFNDWVTDDATPALTGIGAVVPTGDETFVLFGVRPTRNREEPGESALLGYAEETGLVELARLPYKARFLAGTPARVAVDDRRENRLLSIPLGAPDSPLVADGPSGGWVAGALRGDRLYLLPADGERVLEVWGTDLSGPPVREPAPDNTKSLQANEDALLAWDGKSLWFRRNDRFEKIPVTEFPDGAHFSAGPNDTFWTAGFVGDDMVARQYDFAGELLREMRVPKEFAGEVRIFASGDSPLFYLLLRSANASRQTLRGYRPVPSTEVREEEGVARVDWEIFIDKTIENSRRFGLRNGRLVPDAGTDAQNFQSKIALDPDPLTGKKGGVTVTVARRDGDLWLATKDGLPLKKLVDNSTGDRFVMEQGKTEGSVRLFAGNGVVVAEYLISGLNTLAAIDAGEIELP